MNEIFIYIFVILDVLAILGIFFTKKETKINEKKFYKICPCYKLAENGILGTLCAYSAMGGFLYSSLSMSFIGFDTKLMIIFVLSLLSAYLSWSLKSD